MAMSVDSFGTIQVFAANGKLYKSYTLSSLVSWGSEGSSPGADPRTHRRLKLKKRSNQSMVEFSMGQPGEASEVACELDRISQSSLTHGGTGKAGSMTMSLEAGEQAVARWLSAHADNADLFSIAKPQEYAAAVSASLVKAGYEVDEWIDELQSFSTEDLNAFIESVVQHYTEDGQLRTPATLQDRGVPAVDILTGVPWLSPVLDMAGSTDFLEALAAELQERSARVGDIIIRKGDIGDEMYFVAAGSVDVRVSLDKPPVATLPVGSAFGESALLNNLPRNAFVVAADDAGPLGEVHEDADQRTQRDAETAGGASVQLLVLNKNGLARAMSRFPSIAQEGTWLWKVKAQHDFYTDTLEHA
jgi:hypothetical protein